jgi:hypothetical protein
MNKTTVLITAAIVGLTGMAATPAANAAPARKIDRSNVDCSNGARMETSLERSARRLEVDVDIEGEPRVIWTVRIYQGDRRVHTVTRTTNRDGEFDFYRYLNDGTSPIRVTARSASGETCRAVLRP